jgi:HlyD family secretion protein
MMRFASVLALVTIVCLGVFAPLSARPVPEVVATPPQLSADESTSDEKADNNDERSSDSSGDKSSTNGVATKEESSTDTKKPSAHEESDKKEKESAESKADAKSREKSDAKPAKKKRKTHKVEAKRLKIDLPLDGTFVSNQMTEVRLQPEAWTDFEIVEAAPLGAKVRTGETLFKFDDKKINDAIADLELKQRLSELAIMRAEEELPRAEKTLEMNLADAERADNYAKEDYERYNQIDRPMYVKQAKFMAKYYGYMLDYQQDELDQLEKMYEADDLTEETEEIVLKRQRNSVELAEFNLEGAKLNRDEMLNVTLPRFDIRFKENLERTAMSLARAKMASRLDLNRDRYELEQQKEARVKSLDRHAKLITDRGLMEIKSPADGVVYYGKETKGRWNETAQLLSKYEPKSKVSPGSVLMTIVEPRPLHVTATFDEAKRPEVAVGQKVKVAPPGEGRDRVSGRVKSISPIEVAPGKFEVNLEIDDEELPDWVLAGMSCKLKINTYDKDDVLTVPKAAVHTDKYDDDVQYVWLVVDPEDPEAKPERRTVKTGRRDGDDVEIVKGLKKGDIVSLDDEDSKQDKEKSADEKDKD